ncbi:hypothetical protein ABZ920_22530 [Streptomyces sp. NPDC046831]|uniref:hypothetical protein n=1 Tax=Streptomyces sp. NPDC046831 TaxID=3154805 RepID=UPI0033D21C6E
MSRVGRRAPPEAGRPRPDLRGIADRIQLMVEDPGRRCANADATSPASGVVERRLAAIDAEIDRLSRLRARLAQWTGRA